MTKKLDDLQNDNNPNPLYVVIDIKVRILVRNISVVLSTSSPSQALLLLILNKSAYKKAISNLDVYDFKPRIDKNPIIKDKLVDVANIIRRYLEQDFYQTDELHENFSYQLRYFYAAAKAVSSGVELPAGFAGEHLPKPPKLEQEKRLRFSETQKVQKIAEALAHRYFQIFSLNRTDVVGAFAQYFTDSQILNLDSYFFSEVSLARIDGGRYSLLTLLPHPNFIAESLTSFGWKHKQLSNPFKEARFQLEVILENLSYDDLCFRAVKKLIFDAQQLQKYYPKDTLLLTEILTQTRQLLLRQTLVIDLKTIDAIERKCWGRIILGSLLFVVGLALMGLCCASGLGVTISCLAFSLSLYQWLAGASIGLITQMAGISLFSKGKSWEELAQSMKAVSIYSQKKTVSWTCALKRVVCLT